MESKQTDSQLYVKKSSKLYNYSPYLEEQGVWRVRGHIDAIIISQAWSYNNALHLHTFNTTINAIRTRYEIISTESDAKEGSKGLSKV